MEAKLCIYTCNSLVPEISHLLLSENYPDVTVKSFPAICVGSWLSNEKITEMVANDIDQFSKIIIIVSACRGKKNTPPPDNKKIEIIHLEQCFEILLNRQTIYHYFKQGYYAVSNGWLRNYNRHIREWGFDLESARKFFGETIKKILLFDTGLPGDYKTNLEALSEYMGLLYDTLPVGTNHLQQFLDVLILKWRKEIEHAQQNERIAKLTHKSADYELVFGQLKNLIDLTDEHLIVKEISLLLDILFAPDQLCYQQYHNGIEREKEFFKGANLQIEFSPDNSFKIDIKHHNELVASFEIIKVKFPQHIPQYQTLVQVINQIGGLSIANARKYSQLEEAKINLSLSEQRFKAMFNQAPLGIALIDSHTGQIINVNPKFTEILGRTQKEMITIDWMSITHPDDIKEDLDNMARLNAHEISGIHMFKRYIKPNGDIVWASMTVAPIEVAENEDPLHLAMIEDITEQKQAAIALAKNNQKFEFLSRSGTEMLALQTEESIIDYITKKLNEQYPDAIILFSAIDKTESLSTLKSIVGVSEKRIKQSIKYTGFDFFKKQFDLLPLHRQLFKSGNLHYFENGLSEFSGYEFPKLAAKAIEKLFRIKQIYTIGINKDEKLYATIHLFNRGAKPITDNEYVESFVKQAGIVIERKLLENLLAESEERYRLIAENTSDVIWSIDINTLKFNYISPSIINLTGFTVEEAMSKSIRETLEEKSANFVLTELPKRIENFYTGNLNKRIDVQEMQQWCKDGSLIWVEFTTMLQSNNEGHITGILGVTRNINERKRAEIEIQEKNRQLHEANATKDKFFSIISHDLRSPFATLVGFTELMADEQSQFTNEEYLQYSRSLNKTAQSTFNLLENLLEWSRLQRGAIHFNPQIIDIKKFFRDFDDSIIDMAKKKSITLEFVEPKNIQLKADHDMLNSILRNLIVNAIKFTKEQGKISVEVNKNRHGEAQFSVHDTGIGMDQKRAGMLFRLDTKVSRPGTNGESSSGLGLILCKEFVEKHGGRIWAESEEEKGSTFNFTIPIN